MGYDMPNGWHLRQLGSFLTESRIPGSTGRTARKLTVKLYGRGVAARDETRPGSEASKYFRRKSGQLIYSKLDFLNGAFGIIPQELDGYESSSELPCFDVANEVDASWLLRSITRPSFYLRYRGSADGSRKAKRVHVGKFLYSWIPVPSIEEQKAISYVLKAIDDVIIATQALVEQSLMTKYWTMRELLICGHPEFCTDMMPLKEPWPVGRVAPDVAEMPSHWRLVNLTRVAKLESGHTPSRKCSEYWGGDVPWISLQDTNRLKDLEISETAEMVTELGIKNSPARMLPKGTVVLLRTASVGLCSIMGGSMATSQHYANWLCGPHLDAGYLVQVFRHMHREWHRLSAGSVLPDVYMPTFKMLKILLPPMEEQKAIAEIGESFDRRISAERAYLSQLEETKRGLSQELLSGRVRVPQDMLDSAGLSKGG